MDDQLLDGDFIAVVSLRALLIHEARVSMEEVLWLGGIALCGWRDFEGVDRGGMVVVIAFYRGYVGYLRGFELAAAFWLSG